ncbi:MBL fold metallo-hydrolase [Saccharopolyspora spinosa]|uniref:Metallo-beta-lactamase superfamily protein n=1 Tax=Saccharopolyspora spinosa TaxID=60894 RepID=A0A2N3Y6N9_SACSN|nr:MBL fold metallo-hydrolase [Saccharopolyspora spinosa]PKW18535.1 metallo-beta-lactamase superfamily protein [Saccharopolyspora spinosa]
MASPVDHVVTSGTFNLDGGSFDVDNNVWIVGDEHEVLVIDAAHDADVIAEAVRDRRVKAIVCTHAHDDHVNQAPAQAEKFSAPILLNPAEKVLWDKPISERRSVSADLNGPTLSSPPRRAQPVLVSGKRNEREIPTKELAMNLKIVVCMKQDCGVHEVRSRCDGEAAVHR